MLGVLFCTFRIFDSVVKHWRMVYLTTVLFSSLGVSPSALYFVPNVVFLPSHSQYCQGILFPWKNCICNVLNTLSTFVFLEFFVWFVHKVSLKLYHLRG